MAVTKSEGIFHFAAAADAVTQLCWITHVKWFGDAIADGDELKLTDTAGHIVYHTYATADDTGVDVHFANPIPARGVIAATMTHGAVDVYVR
jgi:hypothetical protein